MAFSGKGDFIAGITRMKRIKMTEKNKTRLINNTSLGAATVMGIAGVVSGLPVVQAAAYLPSAVAGVIIDKSGLKPQKEQGLFEDLKAVIHKTCAAVQVELEVRNSYLSIFFQNVFLTLEPKNLQDGVLTNVESWVHDTIESAEKWESIDLTENDLTDLIQIFLDLFVKQLSDYPELGDFLSASAIIDYEKRIRELEKKTQSNIGKNAGENITLVSGVPYRDDIKDYKDKYEEVLFLHEGLPKEKVVCLQDVFTMPAGTLYRWQETAMTETDYENISDAVRDFMEYKPQRPGYGKVDFLFIEGQAAMGKSSLVAWLSWHYCNQKDDAKEILGQKKLKVIRLRDLLPDGKQLNVQEPFEDIFAYLLGEEAYALAYGYTSSQKDKRKEVGKYLLTDTLLILDGFDELCMVESIWGQGKGTYFYNMYRELKRIDCGCKVIVTTRPSYLDIDSLDFPTWRLVMSPFKTSKREKWVEKYEAKTVIPPDIKAAFVKDCDDTLECLLETPLTLYMIAAKQICVTDSANIWKLYYDIFSEEVYDRNYNKEGAHSISQYRKYLYELTAEIAYAVSGEQHFFITVEKLLEIEQVRELVRKLEGLDENDRIDYEKMQDILADCFGVASYFKISKRENSMGCKKSAVEFYHNNIKDYFCCEYIWYHIQKIYQQIPDNELEMEKWFILNFQKLFQFSVFLKDNGSNGEQSMAVRFFKNKVVYKKLHDSEENFVKQEIKNRYFKHFFGKMLQTGLLGEYEYSGKDNILNMMVNIYAGVMSVYHSIYLPYLQKGELIDFTEKEYTSDISSSFIYRILFLCANIHNLKHLKFDSIMFSGIEFLKCDFRNSSFRGCLMIRCKFERCDLRGADFSMANLSYADLREARIDENTCFNDTEFKMTLISKDQLSFMNVSEYGEHAFVKDSGDGSEVGVTC